MLPGSAKETPGIYLAWSDGDAEVPRSQFGSSKRAIIRPGRLEEKR